jgi:class 3 adenylate cyclase
VLKYKSLKEFLEEKPERNDRYLDGALINPNTFPLRYRITSGAILFADLPNYTDFCKRNDFIEIIKYLNRFFAWMEAERGFSGIVDKYIGDEIMLVFLSESYNHPLKISLKAAKYMIEEDSWNYQPKVGIAYGRICVCEIGTTQNNQISVIGSTVNIASRCVNSLEKIGQIRVATKNIKLIKEVFSDKNTWKIVGPYAQEFKGVGNVKVIDVNMKGERFILDVGKM